MFEEQLWEKDGKLQTYTNRWEEFVAPEPPLPPLNNVIDPSSEVSADVLTDDDENYIRISLESDAESGDWIVTADPQGIFADERYTIQEHNIWEDLFESIMNADNVRLMVQNATSFPEEIFTAMNTYYNNPTLENAQSLAGLLQNWIPLPPLENVIHHPDEDSVLLFNSIGEGNFIEMYVRYDEGTDESEVVVVPNGIFADERYVHGDSVWGFLFGALEIEQVNAIIAKPRWFPEEVFLALKAVYEDPTQETAGYAFNELSNRCVVDSVKVSNKAFPVEIENGQGVKMFLTPDLENYLQISYDSTQEDPYLEYTGEGYFDIEAGLAEAVSYLMDAFDSIPYNVEWAERNIWNFADLDDGYTGGTIQPACMSLVQALFDNPTEDNRDALVTYLSQFDTEYEGDPLISDDEAASIIKADLATLNPEELVEKIEESGDVGEFDIVINQHSYHFTATSDEAADVNVNIKGLYYQTSAAAEEGNPQTQVGEVTLTGGGGR